jgi:hypothetical protein
MDTSSRHTYSSSFASSDKTLADDNTIPNYEDLDSEPCSVFNHCGTRKINEVSDASAQGD